MCNVPEWWRTGFLKPRILSASRQQASEILESCVVWSSWIPVTPSVLKPASIRVASRNGTCTSPWNEESLTLPVSAAARVVMQHVNLSAVMVTGRHKANYRDQDQNRKPSRLWVTAALHHLHRACRKLGTKIIRQTKGIPQGDSLSPAICIGTLAGMV